ncbi:MAG: ATP-dependent RecD-like DNA helicase [Streptococcus sp.]|nr:ATP-dependent RecD-like DNA helicase [Streptococcus sp.]
MEIFVSGTITRIIFENASNFFKILVLEIEDTNSEFDDFEIIVTGSMADIIENEHYTFWGELTRHPKYGEQLKVSHYERAKPSANGLISYFSSEHFKGIGKKTAEKIVDLYGENTIDAILEDPSKLDNLSGLSKVNKERFILTLKTNYGTEQIISQLAKYNISTKLALQIHDKYKEKTLDIIQDNPYQLVEEIQGIGFKIADQLAEQIGIDTHSKKRYQAALIHTLLESCLSSGDTYVASLDLLREAISLLENSRPIELNPKEVADEISTIISEGKVQLIDDKIFANTLAFAEQGIKKNICRILEQELEENIPKTKINQIIETLENKNNISYDAVQKEAISKAINSKVFILTGGPGTGKTTVINGFIQTYAKIHKIDLQKTELPILLAAPTGRAARRMNELTGLPSATIHRHLGLNGDNDYQSLEDYLDCELIIIDEFSMVDTWLANQLLGAISSGTQVVIVGDADQLPSVGPGQVLNDLLNIPIIPKVTLTKIFRQSDESTIVSLANDIRQGYLPDDFTQKKADRSFFEAQTVYIPDMIAKIVIAALKSGIDKEEIQILAPMYKGQAGINNLNQIMQNLLNPLEESLEFQFNDQVFRKGDKILHLVNDAQANVFNGDIGYITDLVPSKYTDSKQDEIIMNFDGIEIIYPRNDWLKITLAYAMSIHKSQGSEFQVVILPITKQGGRMLQRNLIYTAITRSKSKLILLGEEAAFSFAAKNTGTKRHTYLIQRFTDDITTDSLSKEESQQENIIEEFILTPDNLTDIDPLIGLTDTDFKDFFGK